MTAPHSYELRVHYEDTDMAGIVYYANYLKFIERARSDWVRGLGIDQNALREDEGLVFAVRHLEADYLSSARFDDVLTVETSVASVSGARLVLDQSVLRDGQPIFQASVTLVCVNTSGQPARLPAIIRRRVH